MGGWPPPAPAGERVEEGRGGRRSRLIPFSLHGERAEEAVHMGPSESDLRPRQRRGGQGWPPALPFALGAWCPGRRLGRGPRALPDASQRLDQKQETERRSLCCPRRLLGGGGRTAER